MDETLQELENELKRLRPRGLSPRVVESVARELEPSLPKARYTTATSWRSWKWAGWTMATAAVAAFAVLFISQRNRVEPAGPQSTPTLAVAAATPAAKTSNRYEPVRATSVLYDLKDDGLAYLPDQTPARQVRYRYVDTYTWKNPATNASLRWSVPRDEVRLVRASLN